MTNRVELTGRLVDKTELRYSPAGVPIARALFEHESSQTEAGVERWIRFLVGVRAAGSPLAEALDDTPIGRPLEVAGVLLRSRQQGPDTDPIIISLSRIERLGESTEGH